MKKYIIATTTALVFILCCMIGVTTYAATNISESNISLSSKTYTYNGAEHNPVVSVSLYDGTVLTQNVDYTVSYGNNVLSGVATATINGIGNYSGTKSAEYKIKPMTVSPMKTVNRATTSFTMTWNSQAGTGITGYKLYLLNKSTKKFEFYKTVSTNSCDLFGLKAGEIYKIRVRAYTTVGGTTIYGEYSPEQFTCTKPAKVSIKEVALSVKSKKIVVRWNKANCTAHEVQYSTDKNFKKNVKTIICAPTTTSKSIKIPNTKKTYYARVRAYTTYDGKTIRGSWSTTLSSKYGKVYATYSSPYSNNKDRTENLRIACKAIDGTVVYPGKTFSFNKTVGKRTKAKGYKKATIFTGPNSTQKGLGGGICQVASTMFNTALIANVGIVERRQHSQRVSYVPLGRDAAISWGTTDFKWKNTTKYPIKISAKLSNGRVVITFKTCEDVSPKKTKLKVTKKGKNFTLKRYVGNKVNYTTKSKY